MIQNAKQMANNTISKSFRLPELDVLWLENMAKSRGVNQTEIISNALAYARLNEGKNLALEVMEQGGIAEDNEAIKTLTQFGIATASGFAGYHFAGFIRKQLDMDEDKGTQVLFGLVAGLGTLLLQLHHDNNK